MWLTSVYCIKHIVPKKAIAVAEMSTIIYNSRLFTDEFLQLFVKTVKEKI